MSVVLDDDPTGTQALTGLPVLFRWSEEDIAAALAGGASAVHLMTNTRSLSADAAEAVTRDAAAAARAAAPGARIVLRGDSTLRGHVFEEYRAVGGLTSVLLLVPALPAAGRVTRDGVHVLEHDGRATPLHETEYARDGGFAYTTSRLLDWLEERSGGVVRADRGVGVSLDRLRATGGQAVTDAIRQAYANGPPSACAPDVETVEDLQFVAAGLRAAEDEGVPVVVRCAPTFAAVLADRLADGFVDPPTTGAGVLIVCGSYVSSTTRQLERLESQRGIVGVLLDPLALMEGRAAAIADAAAQASAAIAARRVALIATARQRPVEAMALDAGLRIARGLARVVPAVDPRPGVIVTKGGITSHVTLEEGLGASAATVVGPLLPGVALWSVETSSDPVSLVVVPGNVGDRDLLVDLVDRLGVGA